MFAIWLAATGWSLLGAYRASDSAASAARVLAADFNTADSDVLRPVLIDLDRAVNRMNDPWVRPVRWIPWIGRQLNAVDDLAVAGREAVGAGIDAIDAIDTATLDDPVEALAVASEALRDALAQLEQISVPSNRWLVGPVSDARAELTEALADIGGELVRYEGLASGLASMAQGQSTYVIAAANTSEMGSASGMLLQYGTMHLDGGAAIVSDFTSQGDLGRPSQIDIDENIRLLWATTDPGHLWQYTSHLSSRASEVARITADMWESDQGEHVDGVIIMSPIAMQLLLEASGTDTIDLDGRTLATSDIPQFFAHDQYSVFDNPDTTKTEGVIERRSLLASVASAALRSVFDGDADARSLVNGLYRALDGRHLVFWSRNDELQSSWKRAGASGDPAANAVKVGVANAGGNKLDQFLDVDVAVTNRRPNAVRLDIDITNIADEDAVAYILGARRSGQYSGHLIVNVPAGAKSVETSGTTSLNASANDGATHSYVFIVELDIGESASWTVDIELPDNMGEIVIEPSGRWPAIDWLVDGRSRADERSVFVLG
ncbi:MAG: DUF4012 domain-containing protein [Actinomycetia bacterium]|nr:DUF4012 domain-containing protein [Actinomycetes bacterium]